MSTTSMAIFSNPLFATYSVYARNASIVDITELFFVQKFSVLFATMSLFELGGNECDNLNFMNFKTDSFKIRKNL